MDTSEFTLEEKQQIEKEAVNQAFDELQKDSLPAGGDPPQINLVDTDKIELKADDVEWRPKNQMYAVISVVGPYLLKGETEKSNALKVRAVFSTIEEAREGAKEFIENDNFFDCHVVEIGSWWEFPPRSSVEVNEHYANERLDQMMSRFRKDEEKNKKEFTDRLQTQKSVLLEHKKELLDRYRKKITEEKRKRKKKVKKEKNN